MASRVGRAMLAKWTQPFESAIKSGPIWCFEHRIGPNHHAIGSRYGCARGKTN
jgi:hypothetical protein